MRHAVRNGLVAALGAAVIFAATRGVAATVLGGLAPYLAFTLWDVLTGRAQKADREERERAADKERQEGERARAQMLEHWGEQARQFALCLEGMRHEGVRDQARAVWTQVNRILAAMASDPAKAQAGANFLQRYLPQVAAIAVDYSRLEQSGALTPRRQEQTLDIFSKVGQAMSKQHETLFAADALNLDIGAQVLDDLLKQSGLLEGDQP